MSDTETEQAELILRLDAALVEVTAQRDALLEACKWAKPVLSAALTAVVQRSAGRDGDAALAMRILEGLLVADDGGKGHADFKAAIAKTEEAKP